MIPSDQSALRINSPILTCPTAYANRGRQMATTASCNSKAAAGGSVGERGVAPVTQKFLPFPHSKGTEQAIHPHTFVLAEARASTPPLSPPLPRNALRPHPKSSPCQQLVHSLLTVLHCPVRAVQGPRWPDIPPAPLETTYRWCWRCLMTPAVTLAWEKHSRYLLPCKGPLDQA